MVNRERGLAFQVVDYEGMREGIGQLLKEIMRIKAEGDYEAIRDLVTEYGTRFNPHWRDQIVRRARAAGLTSNTAFVFPRLGLDMDEAGRIVDVTITYPRDFAVQMLRFSNLSEEWFGPPAYLEWNPLVEEGGIY